MQITSLLAFLVPAICVATAIPPNTTPQGLIEPRSPVSGSIIAPAPNPYPFVVSLIDGNRRHFCGGTLIGPKFVLTATHCLHGKQIREIIVSYGSRHWQAGPHARVVARYDHPQYFMDATVLELDTNTQEIASAHGIHISYARLPPPRYDPPGGTEVLIMGWGKVLATTNQGIREINPPALTVAALTIVAREHCPRLLPNRMRISPDFICTFDTRRDYSGGFRGSCAGDSGGPIIQAPNTLVGIIVAGPTDCGIPTTAGISTRIGAISNWANGFI